MPLPPNSKHLLLLFALMIFAAACQNGTPSPTLEAPVELVSPTAPPTRRASPMPHRIESPTPRPPATMTSTPTFAPSLSGTMSVPENAPPPETIAPDLLTQIAVSAAEDLSLSGDTSLIGRSVAGRVILAQRLGRGPQIVLLVGGIHGGWEVNTVTLMNEVIAHFEEMPGDIAPGLSLVVVPALNPDGVLRGRVLAGRFNARGVDLNRNWGCDWTAEAFWQDQVVNPGPEPFSEPESAALADYIVFDKGIVIQVIEESRATFG